MRVISRINFQRYPNYQVVEFVDHGGHTSYRVMQDNVAFGRNFYTLADAAEFIRSHFADKLHCLFDYM